jgi:hypothetical protein
MHFNFITFLAATAFLLTDTMAAPSFDPETPADAVAARSPDAEAEALPVQLQPRACTCAHVSNPGLYCGYCAPVYSCPATSGSDTTYACSDHVYECSRTGACHDYGVRTSCRNGQGPCDGRDS